MPFAPPVPALDPPRREPEDSGADQTAVPALAYRMATALPAPPPATVDGAELAADRAAARVASGGRAELTGGAPLGAPLQRSPETGAAQAEAASAVPYGTIVDDGAQPNAGQIQKSAFLSSLRVEVERVADQELAPVGRTAADCVYVRYWLRYYSIRPAAELERAIARWSPARAADVEALREAIVARIREAIRSWMATGVINVPGRAPFTDRSARVQALATDGGHAAARSNPQAIRSQLGHGQPLPPATRAQMESGFSADFAGVRVHTDPTAERLASSLHARAFAIRSDIAFAPGQFQPGSMRGDLLLAHELAHVIQQTGSAGGSGAAQERDADRSALRAAAPAALRARIGDAALEAHLDRHEEVADTGADSSGLRLQRCCGPETPDYSDAPEPPDYDATVSELQAAYKLQEQLRDDPKATTEQIDEAQLAVKQAEEKLAMLGVRVDSEAIRAALTDPGGPKDLRATNARIVREPGGALYIGERMTFKLLVDYLPPNELVTCEWGWDTPEESGHLYNADGTEGMTKQLDEQFWGLGNHEHTPAWLSAKKFRPTATLSFGDEVAEVVTGEWIDVVKNQFETFAIEPATPVALVGSPVSFHIKDWAPGPWQFWIDWESDEGGAADYPSTSYTYTWKSAGTKTVTAKLRERSKGLKLLKEASTTIEIQDPIEAANAALDGPPGFKPKDDGKPKGLSTIDASTDRAMAEIGTRAKMGGSAKKYWESRLTALNERRKKLAELEPDYATSKELPADLTGMDADTSYSIPIPAVIVYPSRGKAAIQPISIYLRLKQTGLFWSARVLDVTGQKVLKFDGYGTTALAAAAAAFADWKSDNKYPTGGSVVYRYSPPGWTFEPNFSTTTDWKKAKEWVDGVLAIGGLIVGALLLAAPEATITKVLGYALIALAVARGSVAIYENIDLGYDALDEENILEAVAILTSVVGGAGTAMRAVGATAKAVRPTLFRVGNWTVMASLAADVGTLVYATDKALEQLRTAAADPTLTDDERQAALYRVIGMLLLSGSLLIVTNRGMFKGMTLSDFVKTKLPKRDPGASVTLGKGTRLDLELELRKANHDPKEVRKLSDAQLLDAYHLEVKRRAEVERLAALAKDPEIDALLTKTPALRTGLEANPKLVELMTDDATLRNVLVKRPEVMESLFKHPEAIDLVERAIARAAAAKAGKPAAAVAKPTTPLTTDQRAASDLVAGHVKGGKPTQPGFDAKKKDDPKYTKVYVDVLYEKAKVAQEELAKLAEKIAADTKGAAFSRTAPKSRQRVEDKLRTEYGGDASRLTDMAGSKIVYATLDELYKGLAQADKVLGVKIVYFKDRFITPMDSGYRDVQMNLRMSNGHIAEFRLHLESIEIASTAEHAAYEVRRSIAPVAEDTGRPLTADEIALEQALLDETRLLYEKALAEGLKKP